MILTLSSVVLRRFLMYRSKKSVGEREIAEAGAGKLEYRIL